MDRIEEIARKRSILLTTRMRFSPEVQPVKEAAMDKIIEQILLSAEKEEGTQLRDMERIFASGTGVEMMSLSIMEASLKRLIAKERVISTRKEKPERYRLTKEVRNELVKIRQQAKSRFNSIVGKLFKNAKEGASTYTEPLLRFLCIIFSQLGEEYVRVITGDIKGENFLSSPSFPSALEKIKKEFDSIDHSLFEHAARTFFRERDPEYNHVKWNLTQNYYAAKAIGLDPAGLSLSEEVFKDTVFYLDTNIIISALEPRDRNHRSSLALSKACKQSKIKTKVCQISLDELRKWIHYQRELLEKVKDQIPDELATEVDSIFYQIYYEKKKTGKPVNCDEVFANFKSPADDLKSIFEMALEDDPWFDEIRSKPEAVSLSEYLRLKYKELHHHPKAKSSALHDAMLLLWLQKLRKEVHNNIWLITLDKSLPGPLPRITDYHSFAITLDAFLQWVSPVVVREDIHSDFTAIFAEMIKNRLFPPEQIFTLGHFRVFSEMGMECKNLPGEDVKAAVRYIRVKAPMLNPTDPVDREKIADEMRRFFADPSRKYKQELKTLENELKKRNGDITELQKQFSEYEEKTQKESLKRSAKLRLGITLVIFLALEGIVVLLANSYGEGSNLFQRILNSWPFLGIATPAITVLIGWFYIGRKRLESLGWPFMRIFKHE